MTRQTDCILFILTCHTYRLSNTLLQLRRENEQQQQTIVEQNELIEEAHHIIEGLTVNTGGWLLMCRRSETRFRND